VIPFWNTDSNIIAYAKHYRYVEAKVLAIWWFLLLTLGD
jgi:hypothetical protein